MNRVVTVLLAVTLVVPRNPGAPPAQGYDPFVIDPRASIDPVDLTVVDPGRARKLPLLVYLPSGGAPAPVVLFSHGLGGARTGWSFLGRHGAARRRRSAE